MVVNMTAASKIPLNGLARRLVHDDLLSEEDALEAVSGAAQDGITLISYLVQNKLVSSDVIAVAAADEFGAPVISIDALDLEQLPKDLLDAKLILAHRALPLCKRGNRLFIAISDPTNLRALDEIKFNTGLATEAIVAEDDKLKALIEKFIEAQDTSLNMDESDFDDFDLEMDDPNKQDDEQSDAADDAPIVKYVNKLLLDAIKMGASDIHF